MSRRNLFAVTAVLLILLILSVFTQVWLLPSEVKNVVAVFPETNPIAVPAIIWGAVAIACWQVVAGLIGLKLVHLARDHGLDASNYGWIQAMIGCIVAFIVLVVVAFIALNVLGYTTPAMLGLIGGGVLAMIVAGSLALFLGTRPCTAILEKLNRSSTGDHDLTTSLRAFACNMEQAAKEKCVARGSFPDTQSQRGRLLIFRAVNS